jgi:surface antigen
MSRRTFAISSFLTYCAADFRTNPVQTPAEQKEPHMIRPISLLMVFTFLLFLWGCATSPYQEPQVSKRAVVTILGAGAGALLGAQFGSGRGQLAAVALGTALGGATAYWLSEGMDRNDRQVVNYALENSPDGQQLPWRNNQSGKEFAVTPTRTYQQQTGQYCREFTTDIMVGGKKEQGYGTACRQPDGAWKIVSTQ